MDRVSTRAHQSTVPCGLRDRRSGLELDICRPRAPGCRSTRRGAVGETSRYVRARVHIAT